MSDERPSEVLGGLPHTRPHRRSAKRGAPAEANPGVAAVATVRAVGDSPTKAAPAAKPASPAAKPAARASAPRPAEPVRPASAPGATKRATRSPSSVRQPAQPAGAPPAPEHRRPAPSGGVDLLGSAVHMTAELAEIGISAGARALRGVVARLPRP